MGRTLIEIINQIESDKRGRCISPTHATIGEITELAKRDGKSYSWVKEELTRMEFEDKIYIGNTINDQFIKTNYYGRE